MTNIYYHRNKMIKHVHLQKWQLFQQFDLLSKQRCTSHVLDWIGERLIPDACRFWVLSYCFRIFIEQNSQSLDVS